ncbi:hypothetical protein OROGR_004263 [Orobanche gracilis]
MLSEFPIKTSDVRPFPKFSAIPYHKKKLSLKIVCCQKNASSSDSHKFGFKLAGPALGHKKWKFNDTDVMQESVKQWLSKTRSFLIEVTSPLVKSINDRRPNFQNGNGDVEDILITEQTIDSRTPGGDLSEASIFSIEQFSREMNGLSGQEMQKMFKALVPECVYNDPRNLVEYCCFRFLLRNSSDVHPSLKEPAFQRLIFITMLAWENPYRIGKGNRPKLLEKNTFSRKLVGEEAFVRIAPAVSGLADCPTVHNLFKALADDDKGISFTIWSTYINELLKVHEGRKSYQFQEFSENHSNEKIICHGSSRKQPVIKWEKNMAWPGKLTLTDKALYFEMLSCPLVLEFMDLGGQMRRDVWFAFINEIISVYKFINEFGPKDGERFVDDVSEAHKGKDRAVTDAVNSIARLQTLQSMRRTLDEPTKLIQFSYLQNAPYGDVVLQTLAVNCWAGAVINKLAEGHYEKDPYTVPTGEALDHHVLDVDGSVYLQRWMRSASWGSNVSLAFWKNTTIRRGVVLSKNLVVGDMNLIEKAAMTCRDRYRVAEKTQATIDAAMIEGIPSNINLLKELVLPLTITARNFESLKRWDDPLVTASFLALIYTLIFRNLLSYTFPVTLMIVAAGMLLLKGLKEQGRLGRFFGKVTIYDQPPSNTIQKIIALKEALREVEKYLQNTNVVLLKIRSIALAGNPQITTEVALVLLFGSTVLLLIPFKYVLAFVIFDLFTRELEFRRQMILMFVSFLKDRWDAVPAAPVVVLPFESGTVLKKQVVKRAKPGKTRE